MDRLVKSTLGCRWPEVGIFSPVSQRASSDAICSRAQRSRQPELNI